MNTQDIPDIIIPSAHRKFLYTLYQSANENCSAIKRGQTHHSIVLKAAEACGLRPDLDFDLGINWWELEIERYPIPSLILSSKQLEKCIPCYLNYCGASVRGATGFDGWFLMLQQRVAAIFPDGIPKPIQDQVNFYYQCFNGFLNEEHPAILLLSFLRSHSNSAGGAS